MAELTLKQVETARQEMRKYADPRTETISFSGADMKGIVFLPMSTNQLVTLIQDKEFELEEMRADLQEYRGLYNTLTTEWQTAQNDYDYADERYNYFKDLVDAGNPQYTDDMNTWLSARAQALNERTAATIKLNRLDDRRLLNLADKVSAGSLEIRRLEGLLRQGGRYTKPVELFDLQTVSISSHREKFPVRTCGRVHPKSYTRGPRTIAGSFIFTLFNKAALWDLLQASSNFYSSGVGINGTDSGYPEMSTILVDQLPPFDLTIICSNELGDNSYLALYGIEIVNDGQTLSIQDIITENVMQFVARDYEPMRPMTQRRQLLAKNEPIITPDNYLQEMRTERQRRGIRLNPFV